MWKKPTTGVVKINVDESFHAETLSGATGAVVPNDHGEFIAAATWYLAHISTVDSPEINAIRNGFMLATNRGCNRLIIESDSTFAVQGVNQADAYLGSDLSIIVECGQLAADFTSTTVVQWFGEANEVVNGLAKHASSSRYSTFWDSYFPDFISPFLVNHLAII
uniref:RNase H type-1 domain-containing protein n=1 Tax=Aegilops tauschii subsp. strangulata TaxID=200361 RepID=A0A453DP78_AEGTS